MRYFEVPEPRGVAVIVHGAGEHSGRYHWLIEKWNLHGFDCLIGDLPGQGESRGKRGHIDSFKQYIKTVDRWLKQARSKQLPIVLVGHSMGGLIAIRTLIERDNSFIEAVVLSAPCLQLHMPVSPPKKAAAKVLNHVAPTFSMQSGLKPELTTRSEIVREEYAKDPLRVTKVSARWYHELSKAMLQTRRYPEKVPNIPILLLVAGDDQVVDSSAAFTWFNHLDVSHKMVKEWNGLYHELYNEPEKEEVFRYTIGFVNMLIR
ncbi:alpha/beta hydrolase [Shouchella lehensis]|uniref:Phospholipase n=2 Tax=Shouchella lehensis TaxID=300825 RepID=A0A060LVS6_9BACI|nr:alpha/beta hydrolase [Shouchella lehensis]AIC95356.1 phospholipase [Shouchella lehensis G1]MBG9783847.1 phospholipase [Shouchella lehensis]RQW21164.1 alpha/beta hydrolase [Bacillus sp. C1-1]TES51189.1 alpha/beta hydrolase [Shouchella lehensis]